MFKNKVKVIIGILLCFITINIFSVNIYLANINFFKSDASVEITEDEEKSTELIFRAVKKSDFEGLLKINNLKNTIAYKDKVIKSSLDASDVCEMLNIDYLLYGFIEKTNKYYNAEIHLFDNAGKEDKKTFYVKVELGDFNEVTEEIAYKFTNYMYELLGLTKFHEERKKGFGGIGIYNGAGYWLPIGEWWNIITGLVCFETGVNVVPVTPIVKKRNFDFYFRFGLYINYALGMNKPGYLDLYFHSLQFKIPAEICFNIFFNHVFIIGLGPQVQLDIIYQKLLYDPAETDATAAFSLFGNLSYEYWFGKKKRAGLGINNVFSFTFYNTMYFDYKIMFYSIVRIPVNKKSNGE